MDKEIAFTLNGRPRQVTTDPDRPLLDVIREDLELTGTKYGCGEGRCRACTVIMDGRPILSCVTPVSKAEGKTLTTIEGLAQGEQLHPVQEAFLDAGAMQCGYCTPGMVIQTVALLENNTSPADAEIVEWLNGNVCRCCGYPAVLTAVRKASEKMKEVERS